MAKDPSKRIGYDNTEDIKKHPWFADVNWDDVYNLKVPSPIKVELKDKFDTENFNKDLQKEGFINSFKY